MTTWKKHWTFGMKTPHEILRYVEKIHRAPEDFEEGDLAERILEATEYEEHEAFPLERLDPREWNVSEAVVEEWMAAKEIPPIVVRKLKGRYSIIDGTHRVNAALRLGLKSLPAYVGLGGLPDIPLPPDIPRPEMWTVESIVQAVRDGFTFMIPFVWGESLFSPNAYWIAGYQYAATGLTVGREHTPNMVIGEDGWLRVKTFFRPEMVPEKVWVDPPNEFGVVSAYVEIDPETIDWDLLNRGHQVRGSLL